MHKSALSAPEPALALWLEELPEGFGTLAVVPARFERHEDSWARATKLVGLDADGRRCWVRHVHTQTEDRFDIDECPVEVPLRRQRQTAWRLLDDRWLRLREGTERLESCRPQHWCEGPTLLEQAPPDL